MVIALGAQALMPAACPTAATLLTHRHAGRMSALPGARLYHRRILLQLFLIRGCRL